jgi:hypothetical protein
MGQGKESVQTTDIWNKLKHGVESMDETIFIPVAHTYDKSGVKGAFSKAGSGITVGYGAIRGVLKPYYAPENARQLLQTTREELIFLNACILQVSTGESERMAGLMSKAVLSKVAGVGTAGGFFALVSAFGAATTGTAIASLSGAAATNATLAWIGSLVGGGMAAGATLTGGLSIIAGVLVYKLLGSEARSFDTLSEPEKQIIESSGFIIAAIDSLAEQYAQSDQGVYLPKEEAQGILDGFLRPLHDLLLDQKVNISNELDDKHALLFEQHALADFEGAVLNGFEYFINVLAAEQSINDYIAPKKIYNPECNQAPAFAIGGIIYALLNDIEIADTQENLLAIEALTRMNNSWAELDHAGLSDALQQYDDEGLKGIANNAKGIFHELIYVEEFNRSYDDKHAELFGATNHPGADVRITDLNTGEINDVQLKAQKNHYGIEHHYDRYPDIEVIATEEIASILDGVESSGFSNTEITEQIKGVIDQLTDYSPLDTAQNTAEISLLITAISSAADVLTGRADANQAGLNVIKNVTVATSATLFTAYLFV